MDWVPGVVVAVIELAILLYYFTDFSYKAKSTVWKRLRIYVLVTLFSLLTWAVFDNLFLRTIFVILFLALAFMQMYTGNKWFIAFYVVTCVLVMLFTEVMVNTGIKALLWGLYHINHFAFEFTCVLFTKFITVLLLFLMKKVMRRIIFKKPLMKDLGFMLMQTMTSILFFVFAGVLPKAFAIDALQAFIPAVKAKVMRRYPQKQQALFGCVLFLSSFYFLSDCFTPSI